MIKKLFITPWFGPMPEWMDLYWENANRLKSLGYDWLLDTDIEGFKKRVKDKLNIDSNVQEGTGMVHNYRPLFGVLYADELKGYDFWGHTDFDCVYGNVDRFIPDRLLSFLDVHSNHHNYICGPWTLYRNVSVVNELFREVPSWDGLILDTRSNGWAEKEYTQVLDRHAGTDIRRLYTHFQSHTPDDLTHLRWDNGLFDGEDEIMMCHFNRKKIWPL